MADIATSKMLNALYILSQFPKVFYYKTTDSGLLCKTEHEHTCFPPV